VVVAAARVRWCGSAGRLVRERERERERERGGEEIKGVR
jgi:hypothetical protein